MHDATGNILGGLSPNGIVDNYRSRTFNKGLKISWEGPDITVLADHTRLYQMQTIDLVKLDAPVTVTTVTMNGGPGDPWRWQSTATILEPPR